MTEPNGALSELARGIEEEVRDTDPEMHVAYLDPSGDSVAPDGRRVFTGESALNEWSRRLPDRDAAIIFRYVDQTAIGQGSACLFQWIGVILPPFLVSMSCDLSHRFSNRCLTTVNGDPEILTTPRRDSTCPTC
jgi:hypothetical protein